MDSRDGNGKYNCCLCCTAAYWEIFRLFLIDGIISLPVALSGFVILPDVPEISDPWYLNNEEIAFARKRMEYEGREPRGPYTKAKLKKIFSSWRIYALTVLYM